MLRKQAAQAVMSARHLIVESAVSIAVEAVERMEREGTPLTVDQRGDLVTWRFQGTISQ
jgi:hypothetical protein